MKKLLLLFVNHLLILLTLGQTISPDVTNEYCPNSEITFTVSIPGQLDNISSSIAQITAQPFNINYDQVANKTTFLFKAKFGDNNQAQTFTVSRKEGTPIYFPFKKIKSLFHLNSTLSCTQLQPNHYVLTAPKCLISTFNLSFPQVKYYTEFETTLSCFGNITKYEYLLPANWKLNTTVSDGTTVIVAGNSVTITSEA